MPRNSNLPPGRTIEFKRESAPLNLKFPLEDGNFGMLLIFKDYKFRSPGTNRLLENTSSSVEDATDTIFLPLPTNISDSFNLKVQNFEQGATGAIMADIFSKASDNNNLSNLREAATSAVKKAAPSALTDGTEAAKIIANSLGKGGKEAINKFSAETSFLLRKMIPDSLGNSIDTGSGTFVNPKAALSFEGVEMKNHSFEWTLSPKTPQESEILRQIIKTVNKNILPEYFKGAVSQRSMLKYPSTVNVYFIGIDPNFYVFFKTAMINSFSSNYTPEGMAILKGGRPASVQLSMSMTESDIHTSEDYQ